MPDKILSLPIEKKIGQLFFIGISGTVLDEVSLELLREISPGGICLFARNIREAHQTRNLLDNIRRNLPIPPFLSLDQEGGLVDRLRRIIEPMPSAHSIKNVEQARKLAEITAETIRMLGFNMNFAPVVDVINENRIARQNGIYSRNFGASKEDVVRFASVYLKNLQQSGCLGCLKHFPGLGASEVDSHEDLPGVNITPEELEEIDLFPYREIIKTIPVHAVMVAHAAYPKSNLQEADQNGKLLPSSLSFNFITKLLRESLNFQELVISDDLEMGAILKNYGIGEACKLAVKAGMDMLSICADADNIRQGYKAILEAFEKGDISEDRINESLERIARVKQYIKPPPDFDENRLQALSDEIAKLKQNL